MPTLQPYYTPTDWKNLPATSTPINRTNLFHAEQGIKEADNRIVQLDGKKADQSMVNTLVKDISVDTATGIFTITFQNGATKTYDLAIEKVVTNFDINAQNELVLILADGTKKTIDMSRFIYSVDNTATVSLQISNRVMTAVVVNGSITFEKLDASIQTEFRQYMLDSQAAKDAALQYSKFSKRYAVGDKEYPDSATDNAQYYYTQSKINAEQSTKNAASAAINSDMATQQATIAIQKATSATQSANSSSADAETARIKAELATKEAASSLEQANIAKSQAATSIQRASESATNATLSKRYAVGGEIPADTEDNSKWYYQQAKKYSDIATAVSKINFPTPSINAFTGHLIVEGGSNVILSLDNSGHLIIQMVV